MPRITFQSWWLLASLTLLINGRPPQAAPVANRPPRAMLGVTLAPLTAALRRRAGVATGQGVWIARVRPQSPADRAGLRRGDVLLRLDGKPVKGVARTLARLARKRPGDRVAVGVVRGRRRSSVTVTLARYAPDREPPRPRAPQSRLELLRRMDRLAAEVRTLRALLREMKRRCRRSRRRR